MSRPRGRGNNKNGRPLEVVKKAWQRGQLELACRNFSDALSRLGAEASNEGYTLLIKTKGDKFAGIQIE